MANLFSLPSLVGLGLVILITSVIILGLRLAGLPREVALYLAVCTVTGSVALLYGRLQHRK